MRQIVTAFIISLLAIGCQPEERVYLEYQELSPNLEWLAEDAKEFKVPVEDKSKAYNMSLAFRYISGYSYPFAKVLVTETSPSGTETETVYDLKIIDRNGEYIGEAGYEIWDSEHLVEPNKKYLETGTYTYTIKHNMSVDPLDNVMEIGVILDEVK